MKVIKEQAYTITSYLNAKSNKFKYQNDID